MITPDALPEWIPYLVLRYPVRRIMSYQIVNETLCCDKSYVVQQDIVHFLQVTLLHKFALTGSLSYR